MNEFLKLCTLIIVVVGALTIIVGIIVTIDKAVDKSKLKDIKENNNTLIINGNNINPKEVISMNINGGMIDVKTTDGKRIKSSNFTIITQGTSEKVEK